MTAVLLCGEGPHDIGNKDWDKKTGEHTYVEGWMQPLVREISGPNITFKTKQLRELFLTRRPAALKPIPHGHSDKAAIARLIASTEGCDVVIFMTDADSNDDKERKKKVKEIADGFGLIVNEVEGVPCVPRSASESWLLSDGDAWAQLGLKDKTILPTQSPEELWGNRDDPKGNHPKHAFSRVALSADAEDGRETRMRVCELSSLDKMRKRCPVSLADFADELENCLGIKP